MTRFSYLATWSERHLQVALPSALATELRAPCAALACAVAFAGVLAAYESARLRDARAHEAASARELAQLLPAADAVRSAQRRLAQLRDAAEAASRIAASGTVRANELAGIAEALPDDAWLAAMRNESGTVALEGRATTVDAAARALASLGSLHPDAGARLLSLRTEPSRDGVLFAIAVEPRR